MLAGAVDSPDEASFRQKIDAYLSDASWNAEGVRVVRRLLEYDGRVVHELSVGEDVKVETLALLWRFLSGRIGEDEISPDFALELYHQFSRLHDGPSGVPEKAAICKIMEEADLPINGTTIMRRSSTVRGWLEWIFSQLCLADQRELHLI